MGDEKKGFNMSMVCISLSSAGSRRGKGSGVNYVPDVPPCPGGILLKERCLGCLSFCLGPEGDSSRGSLGDPHTKESGMLRGKLDFRDWRPV